MSRTPAPDSPQLPAEPALPLTAADEKAKSTLDLSGVSSGRTAPDPTLDEGKSLIGTQIGDYELLDELGRGGMGVVYKARQVSLDRIVALKMLLAERFQNPLHLARFLGEAKAVAALDHPDIVKIFQIGECPHGHYFAMEYLDGQLLEAVLGKGPLSVSSAVALMIPLALAIDFAHSKGVIHRDLKPGNIMISKLRRPIVMDFGIAKVAGKSPTVTQRGVVVGTPSFMAPEQASEEIGEIGPATDVYSLGALLYAALTSHAPYNERTALSTILKLVSPEPPPSLRTYRADVPEELERICFKCLNKRPEDRYASARALAEDLRRFRSALKPGSQETRTVAAPSLPDLGPSLAVVLVYEQNGAKFVLRNPVNFVGRGSDCDLVLRSPSVSKRHCQISLEDGQAWVEDLGSANGTTLNDHPLTRSRLQDKDHLDVAGHRFVVRIPKPKR